MYNIEIEKSRQISKKLGEENKNVMTELDKKLGSVKLNKSGLERLLEKDLSEKKDTITEAV